MPITALISTLDTVQLLGSMDMAFGVGNRIPDNSILRKGTLLIGVPRQKPSDSDPMAPAALSPEEARQTKLAEANSGTVPSRKPASTTRK
jgi:hypothetical protein